MGSVQNESRLSLRVAGVESRHKQLPLPNLPAKTTLKFKLKDRYKNQIREDTYKKERNGLCRHEILISDQ